MAHPATIKPPLTTGTTAPAISFAMLSHAGRIRHNNQDACAAREDLAAFVVCDGVGGCAGGDIASRLAADTFLDDVALQPENTEAAGKPRSRIHHAICAANNAVLSHARRSPTLRGMGTTLVAALCDLAAPQELWVAHVGDSRCYRLRRRELELLTQDHSLVEEQVRAGILTRSDAESSPVRNIITRAIGSEPIVEADIALHHLEPGDIFLLASDGLTRELSDTALARILTVSLTSAITSATLQAACQALIDEANASGGRDNITVILIACS